jgi:aspartyl-tRNA(Asn)/glutamyl-tRNA(Gln) amidotransferase subunit A
MTRTVEDAAILLGVMAGPTGEFRAEIGTDVRGLRVGVPRKAYWDRLQDGVGQALEDALSVLASLGAELVDVEVPDTRSHEDVFRFIVTSEAFGFHRNRLESEPQRFGDDVRRRLLPGKDMLAVDVIGAKRAREQLLQEIEAVFGRVDVLVFPTLPITAPLIGQQTIEWREEAEPVLRALTRNTRLASLTGLPAISVPAGFVEGLPVGLQIIGPARAEARIVRVGDAYERETGWNRSPD